uniref:DUF6534 domain-containing protein n=1 Tax=Moniliophthora roreri TaxID=221103 RepID=A0A0W0G0S9_MONRR
MSENLSHIAGPLLSGYLLNWGLYGVLSVQVYRQDVYWTAFPNDSRSAQALVYGIYLLDTAQTFSLTYDALQTFAVGFSDPASVDKVHNLWLDTYLIDGIVAFLVQVYYAKRILRLLPKYKIIPGTIVLLAITQLVGMIDVCIKIKNIGSFSVQQRLIDTAGIVTSMLWIGCSAIADVLIAATMVYSLSRFDTTFQETQSLIRRLNKLMMETCSLVGCYNESSSTLSFLAVSKTKLPYYACFGHRKALLQFAIGGFKQSGQGSRREGKFKRPGD